MNINQSKNAFNLVNQVSDYLNYGLKSDSEKSLEFTSIRHNPFYIAYGEDGFSASDANQTFDEFQSPFYYDEFWNTHFRPTASPKKKTFSQMSFAELLAKMKKSPIPEALVTELKRLIIKDRSLLTFKVDDGRQKKNLLPLVVEYGNLDFFKWLIEQGDDPFFVLEKSPEDLYVFSDAADCAIVNGKMDMLTFLFQRYGAAPFYEKTGIKGGLSPQWDRLRRAIENNKANTAQFLLTEVGYASFLRSTDFKLSIRSLLAFIEGDKTATVALVLKYDLLDDLEEALYDAVKYSEVAVVQLILNKNPYFYIYKFFEIYIKSRNKDSKESIDMMKRVLDLHPISARRLKYIFVATFRCSLCCKRA